MTRTSKTCERCGEEDIQELVDKKEQERVKYCYHCMLEFYEVYNIPTGKHAPECRACHSKLTDASLMCAFCFVCETSLSNYPPQLDPANLVCGQCKWCVAQKKRERK